LPEMLPGYSLRPRRPSSVVGLPHLVGLDFRNSAGSLPAWPRTCYFFQTERQRVTEDQTMISPSGPVRTLAGSYWSLSPGSRIKRALTRAPGRLTNRRRAASAKFDWAARPLSDRQGRSAADTPRAPGRWRRASGLDSQPRAHERLVAEGQRKPAEAIPRLRARHLRRRDQLTESFTSVRSFTCPLRSTMRRRLDLLVDSGAMSRPAAASANSSGWSGLKRSPRGPYRRRRSRSSRCRSASMSRRLSCSEASNSEPPAH